MSPSRRNDAARSWTVVACLEDHASAIVYGLTEGVDMTEPREIAAAAEEVAPGLWTWSISNSNIGGHISSSQALLTREAAC